MNEVPQKESVRALWPKTGSQTTSFALGPAWKEGNRPREASEPTREYQQNACEMTGAD